MKKTLPMKKTRSPFLEGSGKLTDQADFVCHVSFEIEILANLNANSKDAKERKRTHYCLDKDSHHHYV